MQPDPVPSLTEKKKMFTQQQQIMASPMQCFDNKLECRVYLILMPQLLGLDICMYTHKALSFSLATRSLFFGRHPFTLNAQKKTFFMKGVAAVIVSEFSVPCCLNGCPVPPALSPNKNCQRCSLSKSVKSWNGACSTVVTKRISKLCTAAALKGNTGVTGVPTSVPVRVAHELLLAGHRYLDVRTPEEFCAGHVPGAVNIPYIYKVGSGMTKNLNFVAEVASHFREEDEILIGCQLGKRSFMAASDLLAAGFSGITDVAGGYASWTQSELPTTF